MHSAKYVYHTGTSASSTARAGTSCEKEQKKIRNSSSTRWIFFQFPTTSSQSCGEVQRATFSQLTQPIPKPVCDRSGQPEDMQDVLVVKGETSRSHEINEKRLHKELDSSDRSGKPERLFEDIRVKHAHDGTGQLVEPSSSSTHIVKEQFVPEENRDIASFNTDNEFNRAIDEENIDFNIPGMPNSTVKGSHGVNVQKFDSEDRQPPSATSTSN